MEGFEIKQNGYHAAIVGNIEVAISDSGDEFVLEQQNGTGPTDLVSITNRKDAEKIANLLISWVAQGK